MSGIFTKSMARNIFYGGTVFFFLLFLALTFDTERELPNRDNRGAITPQVAAGKHLWEVNNCLGCHTLLGEGAYFAPELGNVWVRYGGRDDPEGAREGLKAWILAQPTGVEGRRQMPKFAFDGTELDDLIDFLEWTSRINTQGWPPTDAG